MPKVVPKKALPSLCMELGFPIGLEPRRKGQSQAVSVSNELVRDQERASLDVPSFCYS